MFARCLCCPQPSDRRPLLSRFGPGGSGEPQRLGATGPLAAFLSLQSKKTDDPDQIKIEQATFGLWTVLGQDHSQGPF